MSYDYEADCTSYICINCNPKIRVEWLEQLNRSGGGSMSPFSLHALITAHTQNGWIEDASLFRMGLVLEVSSVPIAPWTKHSTEPVLQGKRDGRLPEL